MALLLPDCTYVDKRFTQIFFFSSPEPKSHWWAYRICRPPSSIVVRRPHSSNIFSSETTKPIKVKIQMEPPWDGGTKGCSNGPGLMTKMVAMPIYCKNIKNLLLWNQKRRWSLNLECSIGCSSTTKFVQMMTLGCPWPILRQGQIWSLIWGKGKTLDFFRNYWSL